MTVVGKGAAGTSTGGTPKNELKLAVVGAGAVGKTAMTIRFVTSHFYDQGYNPTIEDSYRKQVVVNGEAVTLEVLDTAGQEEYAAMADQWYRYAQGFLLVYSITDRQSFFNLQRMHQDILRVKQKEAGDVACLVVCNKCDLASEREVGQLEARDLARSFQSPFIECSASDGVNVDAAFKELVKLVRRKKRREDKRMAIVTERILAGPLAVISQPSITSASTMTTMTTQPRTATTIITSGIKSSANSAATPISAAMSTSLTATALASATGSASASPSEKDLRERERGAKSGQAMAMQSRWSEDEIDGARHGGGVGGGGGRGRGRGATWDGKDVRGDGYNGQRREDGRLQGEGATSRQSKGAKEREGDGEGEGVDRCCIIM